MNSERLNAVPSGGALKKASPMSMIQLGSRTLSVVLTDMSVWFPGTTLTLSRSSSLFDSAQAAGPLMDPQQGDQAT